MIAVVVSTVIIAFLLGIHTRMSVAYRSQTGVSSVLQTLRAARQTLQRDLRMAGFMIPGQTIAVAGAIDASGAWPVVEVTNNADGTGPDSFRVIWADPGTTATLTGVDLVNHNLTVSDIAGFADGIPAALIAANSACVVAVTSSMGANLFIDPSTGNPFNQAPGNDHCFEVAAQIGAGVIGSVHRLRTSSYRIDPARRSAAVLQRSPSGGVVAGEGDPSAPAIDGYHDLVVFADACGHVYKLDPGVDLWTDSGWSDDGGWLSSATTGVTDTGANDPNGEPVKSLFSVADLAPPVGLGEQRPIVGTIGVRPDSTTRVVLYFGTGGVESYDPSERNQLYAVYADTGELRSVLEGSCNGSGRCEKFYGGVVVSAEQVVVTRSYDPEVGTGLCDTGSSTIQGLALDADTSGNFITQFNQLLGATLMAPLFGHAGAIYSAGLDGTLVRIGAPRAAAAGEDSAAGQGQGTTGEGGTGASGDLQVLGWRHVY
jgi:hypothetical protein